MNAGDALESSYDPTNAGNSPRNIRKANKSGKGLKPRISITPPSVTNSPEPSRSPKFRLNKGRNDTVDVEIRHLATSPTFRPANIELAMLRLVLKFVYNNDSKKSESGAIQDEKQVIITLRPGIDHRLVKLVVDEGFQEGDWIDDSAANGFVFLEGEDQTWRKAIWDLWPVDLRRRRYYIGEEIWRSKES